MPLLVCSEVRAPDTSTEPTLEHLGSGSGSGSELDAARASLTVHPVLGIAGRHPAPSILLSITFTLRDLEGNLLSSRLPIHTSVSSQGRLCPERGSRSSSGASYSLCRRFRHMPSST